MAKLLLQAVLFILVLGTVVAVQVRRIIPGNVYGPPRKIRRIAATTEDVEDSATVIDAVVVTGVSEDDLDIPIGTSKLDSKISTKATETSEASIADEDVITAVKVTAEATTSVASTSALVEDEEEDTWIPSPPGEHPPMSNSNLTACSITNCSVAIVNGTICYDTLADAIAAVPDNGVIEIGSDIVVDTEISFYKSLEIRSCGDQRWTVFVTLNSTEGSILLQTGKDVNVSLTSLKFILVGDRIASVLRTPKIPEVEFDVAINSSQEMGYVPEELPDEGYPNVDVFIQNCRFENFRTGAIGGSVIHIAQSNWFTILDTVFFNNTVLRTYNRFEGGGTIWMRLFKGGKLTINNTVFESNTHSFQHGLGGALGLNYLTEGYLEIHNSHFVNNSATGGGAIFVESIEQYTRLVVRGGIFQNNTALEYGWGSRGGAMWLQNVNGTIDVIGLFQNNTAPGGRGAVFANNMLRNNATAMIGGVFVNNTCLKGASLWDTSGTVGFYDNANLTLASNSILYNNTVNNTDKIIRLQEPKKDTTIYVSEKSWAGGQLTVVA